MFRAQVAILALSLAACVADEPNVPPIGATSHVVEYFLPKEDAHRLDLLFVIDDRIAMTQYQDRLARLPRQTEAILTTLRGGVPDLRIAVTTTGGTLRTSPDIAEPYLAIELHPDGTHTANFSGSLADALAPLLDVGATNTGPNQLLDATQIALTSGPLVRDDARLAIITVSAADDASLAPVADYVTAVKAEKTDPGNIIVSGVYPPGAPRLDAFHAGFPSRNWVTSIDDADWTGALVLTYPSVSVNSWLACFPRPLDVDPETPGDQYDCSMAYWDHDVELTPLPMCGTEEPCWELVEEPLCDIENIYFPTPMTLKVRRSELAHPEVRGQCVVK